MGQIHQQTEQIFPAKRQFIFDHYQTPAKSADFFPPERLNFFSVTEFFAPTLSFFSFTEFFEPKDLVFFLRKALDVKTFFA